MADVDTENKRRSVTGILGLITVYPLADGTIGDLDRQHVSEWYAGIAAGAVVVGGGPRNLLLLGVGM